MIYNKNKIIFLRKLVIKHNSIIMRINKKIRELEYQKKEFKPRNIHKKLISEICSHFWIADFELTWKSKKMEILLPRMVFCYIMRNKMWATLESIWKYINKGHCSVIYSLDRADTLMITDPYFKKNISYFMWLELF